MQNRQSSLFQAIQSLKSVFAEVLESVWLTNSWLGIRHNSQKEWQMLSLWDKLNFQNILRNHRIQACMRLAAVFEGWTFFSRVFSPIRLLGSSQNSRYFLVMGWESQFIFISEEWGKTVPKNSGIKGEETTVFYHTENAQIWRDAVSRRKIEDEEDLELPIDMLSGLLGSVGWLEPSINPYGAARRGQHNYLCSTSCLWETSLIVPFIWDTRGGEKCQNSF